MSAPKPRSRGFTLLEALIGMALLSLLFLVLWSGFRGAIDSWERQGEHSERMAELRVINDFLSRTLLQMIPQRWETAVDRPISFEGSNEQVRFVGRVPARLGPPGLHLLQLQQVRHDGAQAIELRWVLPEEDTKGFELLDTAPKDQSTWLAERVRSFKIEYFGSENDDDEPKWQTDWKIKKKYPQMLRLSVVPERGEPWPPVVVRLPALVEGQGF